MGWCLVSFCAGLALMLCWHRWKLRGFLPVAIVTREHPSSAEIAEYLTQIACRLDERPEKMRLVFTAPKGIWLDEGTDGRLVVSQEGERAKKVDLRNRWIADHPVPLALKGLRLYVFPVEANRFRVAIRPFALPLMGLAIATGALLTAAVYLACSLPIAATLGLWVGWGVCRLIK